MEQFFLIDANSGTEKTYQTFFEDINKPVLPYVEYLATKDIYEIFSAIVISIILEKPITLLDIDAPKSLEKQSAESTVQILPNSHKTITTANFNAILQAADNWQITLLTSGTTGVPKAVTHNFKSFTKSIKIKEARATDVWGLAYNPTHMAGLQVFFQALLNQNTLVNLFGLPQKNIFNCLQKFNITHVSATPTFYKMLLPCAMQFKNVKQVTFGGEKFSAAIAENLHQLFPNAKFTNVYASTEAGALFATQNDGSFCINEKNKNLVKVLDDELLIHKSIVGKAADIIFIDDWYHTGDMIMVISENPFLFNFVSRKNEMINVGGSKVNPHEVEEALLSIAGVKDAKVFGKSNSVMGNILCAEVVLIDESLTDKFIRQTLKTVLADYKVPRSIKFVDALEVTRTGKKNRQ